MGQANQRMNSNPPEDLNEDPNEDMQNASVDLLEYLERQDNPDPDFHPAVETVQDGRQSLPPAEHLAPPPYAGHSHNDRCPYQWKPPSLRPIFRLPGRGHVLSSAGIFDFLKYDFPRTDNSFIVKFKDFTWLEDVHAIVVAPTIVDCHGNPVINRPGRTSVTLSPAYLQKIWPTLPSSGSHQGSLAVAPTATREFSRAMEARYFALVHDPGSRFVSLDCCFHQGLYRYLLRLSYLFGWPGFPDRFPVNYLPMAMMTFLSGAQYPWADLIMRELVHDLRHSRRCPNMVRIWEAVWNYAARDIEGRAEERVEVIERRFQYKSLLQEQSDLDSPFRASHFHAPDISPFTPRLIEPFWRKAPAVLTDVTLRSDTMRCRIRVTTERKHEE